MALLRETTKYNSDKDEEYIDWFWEILNEFSEEDKRNYIKFVNGSSRLPSNMGASGNASHTISELYPDIGQQENVMVLPQSHMCYFEIDLYSGYKTKEDMHKALHYAITMCGHIDNDGDFEDY